MSICRQCLNTFKLRVGYNPHQIRQFTRNTWTARPRAPFLSPVTKSSRRLVSTENKTWLKDGFKKGVKYAIFMQIGIAALSFLTLGLSQQDLERKYGSSPDWTAITRIIYRLFKSEEEGRDGFVDWQSLGIRCLKVLERLEDPTIDGAGLTRQEDGGMDATSKSEDWRRGYADAVIKLALSAENSEGWVMDKTTRVCFPRECVVGPSNPYPRHPGEHKAPLEENCEPLFDDPESYYLRILNGKGFNDTQLVDAGLGYAAWLDYKQSPKAEDVYTWCLDKASSDPAFDKSSRIIRGTPSANLFKTVTAYAIHHAQRGDVATALPMFLSALQAQRSLPEPPPRRTDLDDPVAYGWEVFKSLFGPSGFLTPANDGTQPPTRDKCDEAALMMYIGEILFVSSKNKEEGISWTRDSADQAEAILRTDKLAKEKCRDCLRSALNNWETMVERLANAEENKQTSWFSNKGPTDRWRQELALVEDRKRRSVELIEPPLFPKSSWFIA